MDTNNLRTRGQSVKFYLNKWISGMIRNGNELKNPNQNPKLKESIKIIKICPIKWITPLTPMDTSNLRTRGQSVEFY